MNKLLAPICAILLTMSVASANWEYGGGYYDDGGRMLFSVRGGIAAPSASMKNDLGSISISYYTDGSGNVYTENTGGTYTYLGTVDLGKLPVAKKYESYSWVGGASVGMIVGKAPQLRLEVDWMHIAETDFNSSPLFSGEAEMGGDLVENSVAAARTTVATDIVSAMIYYDFFSGIQKPLHQVIPYIGAGLGYATSTATLDLTDAYGDLSGDVSMGSFGTQNGSIIDFYTSQTETNNYAISAGAGLSYGLSEGVFFDFGGRISYVPKIRWALNNDADSTATTQKERDIFSANDITFISMYAGMRFEF